MQLLKGKKAIVTGGTAGIGKGIALEFVRQGASVAIIGTNAQRALEVVSEMQKIAPDRDAIVEILDVSDKKAVDTAVESILAKWGDVDILVNNAGITRDRLLMRMTEEDWDQVLAINLKSVYNFCQALVRPMLKAKRGKIINISSVAGLIGNGGQTNYSASKAGMIGFSKSLAQELAKRGICVNCIAPGFIDTKMTEVLTDEQKEAILGKVPMARLGNVQDIANGAVFLGSDLSDYVTGQVLTIDGGMVM